MTDVGVFRDPGGSGLHSEDDNGNTIFWSFTTDAEDHLTPKLRRGINMLTSEIPPKILNEGWYTLVLMASIHNSRFLWDSNKAPRVQFELHGDFSKSSFWNSRRPGMLAPTLSWRLEDNTRQLSS